MNMGIYCEPCSGVSLNLGRIDPNKPLDINGGRAKVVIDAIKILKAKNTEVPIIGKQPVRQYPYSG